MPAVQQPTTFTVTKDCEIEGTVYLRGATITPTVAKTFRKLNQLVSSRTLVPDNDPHYRKTDSYGPGDPPRKHPTPTGYHPVDRGAFS